MYLKKLEISGFKSFAKTTVLEFPLPVTAVVGPNGSGKSNIKESIQWALGEQSMKSLRGKKGEDLIWNGSPMGLHSGRAGAPRMGKASVTLLFDNHDRKIPLDFDEVAMTRKVFRDGLNEYFMNDSPVRLKDMTGLGAQMGLGESKHNIIGQGEVDRLLMVTPRERRAMLEDALGLRVYQLKRSEAERKLTAAHDNVQQAEASIRELVPHIKFLRVQAEKAAARERIAQELREMERAYAAREWGEIAGAKRRIAGARAPIEERREHLKQEILRLTAKIAEVERVSRAHEDREVEEREIARLASERRELDRELGRLEGRIETEKTRAREAHIKPADMAYAKDRIRVLVGEVRALLRAPLRLEASRERLDEISGHLERLVDEMERGFRDTEDAPEIPMMQELIDSVASLQKKIGEVSRGIEAYEVTRAAEEAERREAMVESRTHESLLRALEEEDRDMALQAERIRFEAEQVAVREVTLFRECVSFGIDERELTDAGMDAQGSLLLSVDEARRKMERMRGHLEEVGGIDPAVISEHRASEERHTFLTSELADMRSARASLEELIHDLDERMKRDFHEGFRRINTSFHEYFTIIFGGGKASLVLNHESQATNQELEETGDLDTREQEDGGIEIMVDLPRKRIRGLAMLSGGERALTAIALLFAIIAVNPPPFLILDETDAALDEANSQRYAAIVKELAKHTQLIVITHNRETMKSAGVLYGITMGEDGVSKVLSLKLEEAEEYTNR